MTAEGSSLRGPGRCDDMLVQRQRICHPEPCRRRGTSHLQCR